MGVLLRGAKNAFRNTLRTFSVTLILGISIGLALVMLLSYRSVQDRITSVQSAIGNQISLSPAGSRGFEGGGEPLTDDQLATVRSLSHVTKVSGTLSDRLTPVTDTSLASAIDPGTLGARFNRNAGSSDTSGRGGGQPRTFTIPIMVTGVADTTQIEGNGSKIISGSDIDPTQDVNQAVIGSDLATKNNLTAGSTFTAYGTTITVKGIYDAGNRFGNAGIYMPVKAVQRLSQQAGQLTAATVQVDSITNVDAVTQAIKDKLGSNTVDVTSSKDEAVQALTPLENIRSISLYSLVGALVAGAIITLLTMMMIVRERRREIGVLKAIGASNLGVVMQFVSESLVLTLLGSVAGVILGVLLSNPVLNALVSSNVASAASPAATGGGGRGFGGGGGRGFARVAQLGNQLGGGVQGAVRNLHASVGSEVLLYGLLAAVGIAIIGSALPAWLIAKVKPAEVMRGE